MNQPNPSDPMTDNECIGLEISIRREELGLTQEELGQKINRNRHTIGLYEMGAVTIRPVTLRKLARALGCRVADFTTPFDEQG